jgi:hypothetical protein
MPEGHPQFADLERLLWQAGIIDDCSKRLIEELEDHFQDLEAEERARGIDPRQAHARALHKLGKAADIAAAAAQRNELLDLSHRRPLLAGVARGLVTAVCVPALPVYFCARRREPIARWCASVGLAGLLTAALLLSMQTLLGAA